MSVVMALAPTSAAGIITASATVLTALGGLLLAIAVLIPLLRETKKTHAATLEVHQIVNQQRTDMQRYQRALVGTLRAHGIDVPADQSLDEPPAAGVGEAGERLS